MSEKDGYSKLKDLGSSKFESGRYEEALELFLESQKIAEELKDENLAHRAKCNVSATRIQLGQYEEAQAGLRQILLQSRDENIKSVAARQIAISLTKSYEFEKASEYLRTALEYSRKCGSRNLEASTLNMLGNIKLNMGEFGVALDYYQEVLEIYKDTIRENLFEINILMENMGYCLVLNGEVSEGISLLEMCLRIAKKIKNQRNIAESAQDLCFAYLLTNNLKRASRFGSFALKTARSNNYPDIIKNCYYLLMEISLREDRTDDFDSYFDRFQEMFPGIKLSKTFFRMFDISDIVNLKEII